MRIILSFAVIMALREEGMETVCRHFGSTLPQCLEAAAKVKTTLTAQGKKCSHTHMGFILSWCALLSLWGHLVTDG